MTYCNYKNISDKVASVAQSAGRQSTDVQLIAVSKTVDNDAVVAAATQGATNFAENRPDCLIEKAQANPQLTWHFIGNIQSRHIPDIVQYASLIHSLCQYDHAEKINKAAKKLGKIQNVLVEVNVSGEVSKAGVNPNEAKDLVCRISKLSNVCVCGLMTMAPIAQNESETSKIYETFEGLRNLRDTIKDELYKLDLENATDDNCESSNESNNASNNEGRKSCGASNAFTQLSMGMSGDWQVAIECGATMVRIGRAIFQEQM